MKSYQRNSHHTTKKSSLHMDIKNITSTHHVHVKRNITGGYAINSTYSRLVTNRSNGQLENENVLSSSNNTVVSDNIAYFIEEHVSFFPLDMDKKPNDKYIVYDCSLQRKGRCGGWADRLSGIVTTFIISRLTQRQFMIHHDYPCELENYVVPNRYDWRFNRSKLGRKTEAYYFYDSDENVRGDFRHSDLNRFFSSDVSYVRVNWNYIVDIRLRKDIRRLLPWITKYSIADIERSILQFLFKPSNDLLNSLKRIDDKRRYNRTVCAHIRIGQNPSLPNDRPRNNENALTEIWNFLKLYDQLYNTIFVASDAESVKDKARSILHNVMDVRHKITHIDLVTTKSDCEGFRGVVKDFFFLQSTACDVLVLSESGFSIKAAFMRTSSEGLFCMRRNTIIPCSRYTLRDIYPHWFRPYMNIDLPEYQLLL